MCSDMETCITCDYDFWIEDGKCINSCEDGYYKENDKCEACHETC